MNVKGHYLWLQRLTPLLVALMIVNVISVFRGFWWNDTYQIIWTLLVITSLIHFFGSTRLPRFVLYLLDLIAIVPIVFLIRKHRFVPIAEDITLWPRIWHFVQSLHPFIEIALAVFVVQMIFSAWITTKKRLYILFAFSLLVLCVKDSYSPLKLSLEIALIVVLFLVWHSIIHFHHLQQKSSNSFELIFYRPLAIIAPMIIVIGMLLIIGMNLPAKPPLLEDPYALWKHSRGEKVVIGNGLGKGYNGNISTSLDGSSLNSRTSGYSRTDSELGGSFEFDYSPIMTVKTTHKSYWRGESRYYYDGTGWYDTSNSSNSSDSSEIIRVDKALTAEERPLAQTVTVEQQYNFVREAPLPVLFAAGQASKIVEVVYRDKVNLNEEVTDVIEITTVGAGELLDGTTWKHYDWRIEQQGDSTEVGRISTYNVESEVIVIDHEALSEATATIADETAMKNYTSLPPSIPNRVSQLAHEITANASSDYEKVLLLEQHLKSSYNYTNTPDETKLTGKSPDFVDQFLFELQEGYCDYFSTSMAIMARTLNIPSRWVKGFSSGVGDQSMRDRYQYSNIPDIENLDTSGTYTVRNADAHSWVEVYFEGYGWIAFEPTPGFAFPYTYVDDNINPLENSLDLVKTPLDTDDMAQQQNGFVNSIKYAIITILAAVVIIVGVKYRMELLQVVNLIRYRKYTMNERVIIETTDFINYCYRNGLTEINNATLRETVSNWNFGSATWRKDLQQLLHYYEKAYYSGEVIDEKQLSEVKNLIKHLKKNWYS